MRIDKIVRKVNQFLAEEMLPISRIKDVCDDVIDDINERLCSCYPTLSDFCDAHMRSDGQVDPAADYNYFPDEYIRQVVCKGAAYLYYVKDEEGNISAQMYGYKYDDALFNMTRDWIEQVPVAFRKDTITGAQAMSDNLNPKADPVPLDIWSW